MILPFKLKPSQTASLREALGPDAGCRPRLGTLRFGFKLLRLAQRVAPGFDDRAVFTFTCVHAVLPLMGAG